MEQCIICGKESKEMAEHSVHGRLYKNICPMCKSKLEDYRSPQFSIWIQRMIEIDKFTDEGLELLETLIHSNSARRKTVYSNAKWSKLFSLIMTFVGIVTMAIGAGAGYLISDIIGEESMCVIIGLIIGGIVAVFEIAFGKVIAEIGENIAAIRTNSENQ